jgi:transposase
LFAIRQSIIETVLRREVKNVMRLAQTQIIDEYLSKRNLKYIAEEKDPLNMASNSILNGVIKGFAKDVVRDAMRNRVFDSLIEAQFLKLFNGDFIKKQVRLVA